MRHPVLFWLAVVAAAATTAVGVFVATVGYAEEQGPDGAVRGYFAALAAADARTALAYGTVPAGSHALLTAAVLREQQRIAPITDVAVGVVTRAGSRASVRVAYTVAFPGNPQRESDTVVLHERDDRWRLDTVAVGTALHLPAAAQRARIDGRVVPSGDTLLFPGAIPVAFDTPYLELRPDAAVVTFGAQPTTLVFVQVSDAGRRAVSTAVTSSLDDCYSGRSATAVTCPQPSERYVPGALRGRTVGSMPDEIAIDVQSDPTGQLLVTGRVQVQGTFRRLTFTNQVQSGTGMIVVAIEGRAYPVAPLRLQWDRSAS